MNHQVNPNELRRFLSQYRRIKGFSYPGSLNLKGNLEKMETLIVP